MTLAIGALLVTVPPVTAAEEPDPSAAPTAPAWDYRTLYLVWDADAFDWRADWNDGTATTGLETILDNEGRDGWAVDSIVTELTEVVVGAESTSHEARRLRVVFRRPATDDPATQSAVSISGFAFQPATLEVAPGTTVTWTNEDGAPHTVTSDDGTFDSGELGSGGTFSTSFAEAGTFAYSCRFHPGMTGTVVVG